MNSKYKPLQSPRNVGLCYICLTRGNHKSLNKDYYCYGNKEVYQDLIADCFNVQVSLSACKLICLQCVERLREALSFKELITKALGRLGDPLSAQDQNEDVEDCYSEVNIKFEDNSFEIDAENVESLESCAEEQYDFQMDLVPGELELLQRFNMAPEPLPTSVPDKFRMFLDMFKDKVVKAKDVAKILKQTEERTLVQPANPNIYYINFEKKSHLSNISTILNYSNVTLFRGKSGQKINCFFCRETFETIDSLKQHNKGIHKKESAEKIISRMGVEAIKVYVDVSNLKCEVTLTDLTELRNHLEVVHEKVFHKKYTDRVVPFNLSALPYYCVLCKVEFVTFGTLERHMNVHFRNYICKVCGNGYITKHRLKVHATGVHLLGSFPCKYCKKPFKSQTKQKYHERVHYVKERNKCPHCSLRFNDYFLRAKHMADEHGAKRLTYNCKVCERKFIRGNALTRHMKRDHLNEREYQCESCPYKCYFACELKRHNVKHTGERTHECKVCGKSYARVKTLREHMRIHNNDRRFVCAVCGQAFVQKCSLKGHIKTHH